MTVKMMRAARYHPVSKKKHLLAPMLSCPCIQGNSTTNGGSPLQDTKKVQVDQVPVPSINENEVLVRMGSASLCHSDLMVLDGTFPASDGPVILGHEGAGVVDQVGKQVHGFKVGDRVGFLPVKNCCCESADKLAPDLKDSSETETSCAFKSPVKDVKSTTCVATMAKQSSTDLIQTAFSLSTRRSTTETASSFLSPWK